jgi:hypothetical protein
MPEHDEKKDESGELKNDELESVAGGVTEGGCVRPWPPLDPPIEIDPILYPVDKA